MPSVAEIQLAILELPRDEYVQLREWLSELDWERWEKQMAEDSDAGRLGFLIGEAAEATKAETLRPLEDL